MMKAIWITMLAAGLPAMALSAEPSRSASAGISKADGTAVGRATVSQGREGIVVAVSATGLPPGHYGIHIHTTGLCEGPAFASAGAHWNPGQHQHGTLNPLGHHEGDLPNLDIGADGAGSLSFIIRDAQAWSGDHPLFDSDGASIVIHAAPDDYRTDPSGNSGARVACGVLR